MSNNRIAMVNMLVTGSAGLFCVSCIFIMNNKEPGKVLVGLLYYPLCYFLTILLLRLLRLLRVRDSILIVMVQALFGIFLGGCLGIAATLPVVLISSAFGEIFGVGSIDAAIWAFTGILAFIIGGISGLIIYFVKLKHASAYSGSNLPPIPF